jgi:hypothetical protein
MGTTTEAAARRKFGLLDAIILVAAAALSCFWWRRFKVYYLSPDFSVTNPSQFFFAVSVVRRGFSGMFPVLAPFTFALIPLRALRPRPSWRRVMCQPGAVACLTAGLTFSIQFTRQFVPEAANLIFHEVPLSTGLSMDYWAPAYCESTTFGLVILAAWLPMALGRRWRPEPTWVDRFGRLLAFAWVAAIPVQVTLEILWPLALNGLI